MTQLQPVLNRIRRYLPSGAPPLLITSSVHSHAPFVKLSSAEERISLTLEGLDKWLMLNDRLRIVICDGSSFDFSELIRARFPQANIDCLFFENDQEAVFEFGKGWGEGEIVKYALHNSSLLRRSRLFAKCTSKIFLSNFAEIFKFWNGTFLCDCKIANAYDADKINLKWIDTRFYIIDKHLYLDKFVNAHLDVRDRENRYLEHCFKDVVVRENIERFMLPVMPLYDGVSGTTAQRYSQISTDQSEEDKRRRESIMKLTNYLS